METSTNMQQYRLMPPTVRIAVMMPTESTASRRWYLAGALRTSAATFRAMTFAAPESLMIFAKMELRANIRK